MFRHVTPEEWSECTAIIGFVLTFLVFAGAVLRAWRLERQKADKLARLPLENESTKADHRHE